MKNFYIATGLLAVAGVVVLGMALRGGTPATEPVDLGEIENQDLLELAEGVPYGNADAPVTILEFGDYQCDACMQFGLTVKPQVDLAYIQSGEAKLVFHDFPLLSRHMHAFLAARAARCAGDQERYFEYHDQLFRTQPAWSLMPSATGHFKELAGSLGLEQGDFNACLDSDKHRDVVTANMLLGQRLGVDRTPTLFVSDGNQTLRLGGMAFVDIQQAMEALGRGN